MLANSTSGAVAAVGFGWVRSSQARAQQLHTGSAILRKVDLLEEEHHLLEVHQLLEERLLLEAE